MSAGGHARALVRFERVGSRWPVATKASVAVAGPVLVAALLGRTELGLMAGLGAFSVLYGPTTPGRFRRRLMAAVSAALVGSVGLGALAASLGPVAVLVAMVLLAAIASTVCVALKVGPPGAFFLVLVCGVASFLSEGGVPWHSLVLTAAVGGAVAVVTGTADLWWDRHGPERRAVEAAEQAVAAFERAGHHDVRPARTAASRALHHAWTSFRDSVGERPLSARTSAIFDRIGILQTRYTRRTAEQAGRITGAEPNPWGDPTGADAAGDRPDGSLFATEFESEQLRDSSLGRPDPGYLLRHALRWPSQVLLIAIRVGTASLAAGVVALVLHAAHPYWTVAFATLVLHQGGTRTAQTIRAVQRLLGTVVGLGVYALVAWWGPGGVWVAVLIFCLQFVVEILVVRNYGAAVVFITPLALTIASAGHHSGDTSATMLERLLDTAIAVVCALVVLWLLGRGLALLIARTHARRCILAVEIVMHDLADSRYATATARMNRRHLYYELLELERVVNEATADEPARLTPYRQMFEQVATLGYLVLGACWHPQVRRARDAFGRAVAPLRRITAHPVSRPRSAEDIHADVLAVQAVITDWR